VLRANAVIHTVRLLSRLVAVGALLSWHFDAAARKIAGFHSGIPNAEPIEANFTWLKRWRPGIWTWGRFRPSEGLLQLGQKAAQKLFLVQDSLSKSWRMRAMDLDASLPHGVLESSNEIVFFFARQGDLSAGQLSFSHDILPSI
jgi:hypothetical protein